MKGHRILLNGTNADPSPGGLTQCDRTEVELMISDTLDCSAAENNETKPSYLLLMTEAAMVRLGKVYFLFWSWSEAVLRSFSLFLDSDTYVWAMRRSVAASTCK